MNRKTWRKAVHIDLFFFFFFAGVWVRHLSEAEKQTPLAALHSLISRWMEGWEDWQLSNSLPVFWLIFLEWQILNWKQPYYTFQRDGQHWSFLWDCVDIFHPPHCVNRHLIATDKETFQTFVFTELLSLIIHH